MIFLKKLIFATQKNSRRSLMDRMEDSGSFGTGSIPVGGTNN
jgi:hypothetical protein